MKSAPLLIELLTEELPPKALKRLGNAFAEGIATALERLNLIDGTLSAAPFMTPRRLAVLINAVWDQQPDQWVERKGPSKKAAFDENGAPTKALEGFMRSCQATLEDLIDSEDGHYLVYRSLQKGQPLASLLAEVVETAAKNLPIPKLMRWGDKEEQFVRPVHGLIMMLGDVVVPGTVMGLESQATTSGHRFLGQARIHIPSADQYEAILELSGHVMASFDRRQKMIQTGLFEASQKLENATVLMESALLEEVTGLVEYPAVYSAQFEEEFLSVPQECLILSMTQHQKYFPLVDEQQKLLSHFLIVSNMTIPDPSRIISGNQRVLRARLSDARFFYEQDIKTPLETRNEALKQVVYHNRLGTQYERVERIRRLADHLAAKWTGACGHLAAVSRAATLCKADLVTDMVGEFPELQGIMGRYYALADGEAPEVAAAIEAHYWPKFSGDQLPAHPVSICCALADRLDILVGIFGIGLIPTGDKDPFGLRRQSLGVIRILMDRQLPFSLRELLGFAFDGFSAVTLEAGTVEKVYAFMLDRLKYDCLDRGFSVDIVDSVLSLKPDRFDQVLPRMQAVQHFLGLEAAQSLAGANKRIVNILKKNPYEATNIVIDLLQEQAEKALYDALVVLEPLIAEEMVQQNFSQVLIHLAGLREPIDAFFNEVMVIDEDIAVRHNRLALLNRIAALANGIADLSKLAV